MPSSVYAELTVHLANGESVRYFGGRDVREIVVPSGEPVTLEAMGQFDFGLEDIQLRALERNCVFKENDFAQCSYSQYSDRPTASNPWKPGEPVTTERRVSYVITPFHRGPSHRSFEVYVKAIGPERDPEEIGGVWIVPDR